MPKLKNGHIPQVLSTEYASYRDEVIALLSSELAHYAKKSHRQNLVIYDPMAGTAPFLSRAECNGYTAYFNDLNSLHLYINAAKTLKSYHTFKRIGQKKLLSIMLKIASGINRCPRIATEQWIEDSVLKKLALAWKKSEEHNESIAILTKAVILLTIRDFASFVKTKNPTWLKPGGLRRNISAKQAFQSAIERLNLFYQNAYAKHLEIRGGHIFLTDEDASKFSPNCKVDVIITSPPFCNRVDWDRIYAPEHFFLASVGVWHTKSEFLGTTTVKNYSDFDSDFSFLKNRSNYLKQFLAEVQKRQRRKELRSDYYVKYFTQYFSCLFRIFDLAISILNKKNAGIYFVIQENVHRGLLIDIGQALTESLSFHGFHTNPIKIWERHHLGLQNVSKRYRLISPKQRELIWHAIR